MNYYSADLHCDTALRLLTGGRLDSGGGHVSLKKLKAGHIRLQVFACWVTPKHRGSGAVAQAEKLIAAVVAETQRLSDDLQLVADVDSWKTCQRQGKIGVLLGIEGGHALGGRLENLEKFRRLGVRILTLTWNNSNAFARSAWSAMKTGRDSGLTPLGRELLAEAGRLGVIIDLSHSSRRTFWDVLQYSRRPVIASHSCVSFYRQHFRNLDDEQIKALAGSGGLLGINFYPGFLRPSSGRPPLTEVVEQFVYVKELAGPQVLALGSDFDGISKLPPGLEGPHRIPHLLQALRKNGFRDDEIEQVALGNLLRLLGWPLIYQ